MLANAWKGIERAAAMAIGTTGRYAVRYLREIGVGAAHKLLPTGRSARLTRGEQREHAKVVFAEDVASLANANGGVSVVGVTDKREIVGIGDDAREIENRLKFASNVLANHLEYDRPIVTFQQVVMRDKTGADKICLVLVVKQACGAVAVRDGEHYS